METKQKEVRTLVDAGGVAPSPASASAQARNEKGTAVDEKVEQEKLRANFVETRERMKREMDKVQGKRVETENKEKPALAGAFKMKQELSKISEVGEEGGCLQEALEIRKLILEERAKCIANGFPNAAKIFSDSNASHGWCRPTSEKRISASNQQTKGERQWKRQKKLST